VRVRADESGGAGVVPQEWAEVVQLGFGDRVHLGEQYAGILADEGIEWGLIGPREADRLWDRHIVNSLCVMPLIDVGATVADIGSGAGLPGIPLAIARPDLRIDLVEPMQRRVDFLSMCVGRLGLEAQVRVVRARVEEYEGHPQVVTCRAVASVARLVELTSGDAAPLRSGHLADTQPLVPPAELLAIKGERAEEEIRAAKRCLQRRGLTADVSRPEIAGRLLGTVVRVRAA
jgi:16S rRNA (guanine527-N7)-methyltransferase